MFFGLTYIGIHTAIDDLAKKKKKTDLSRISAAYSRMYTKEVRPEECLTLWALSRALDRNVTDSLILQGC